MATSRNKLVYLVLDELNRPTALGGMEDGDYIAEETLPEGIRSVSATVNDSSGGWESTLLTVSNTSAVWESGGSPSAEGFERWNASYDTVSDSSNAWNDTSNTVAESSNAWDGAYASALAASAVILENKDIWDAGGDATIPTAVSAPWESTYESVLGASGDWDNTFTKVDSTSGVWDGIFVSVDPASGGWNTTKTNVDTYLLPNYANWNQVSNTVATTSNAWNDTKATVDAGATSWDGAVTDVNAILDISSTSFLEGDTPTLANNLTINPGVGIFATNLNLSGTSNIYLSATNTVSLIPLGNINLTPTNGKVRIVPESGGIDIKSVGDIFFSGVNASCITSDGVFTIGTNADNQDFPLKNTLLDASNTTIDVDTHLMPNYVGWTDVSNIVTVGAPGWDGTTVIVNANYANWNTVSNTVATTSNAWNDTKTNVDTYLLPNYANWNTVSNTVATTSNAWNDTATKVTAGEAGWNDASNAYNVCGTNWNAAFDTDIFPSALGFNQWNTAYTIVNPNYAGWNQTSNTVATTSNAWNDTTAIVNDNYAGWNDASNAYANNGASWDEAATFLTTSNTDTIGGTTPTLANDLDANGQNINDALTINTTGDITSDANIKAQSNLSALGDVSAAGNMFADAAQFGAGATKVTLNSVGNLTVGGNSNLNGATNLNGDIKIDTPVQLTVCGTGVDPDFITNDLAASCFNWNNAYDTLAAGGAGVSVKGTTSWNSLTSYVVGDIVFHENNGSWYYCVANHSNNEPSIYEPFGDSPWINFAGPTNYSDVHNPTNYYPTGSVVSSGVNTYICIDGTATPTAPITDTAAWLPLGGLNSLEGNDGTATEATELVVFSNTTGTQLSGTGVLMSQVARLAPITSQTFTGDNVFTENLSLSTGIINSEYAITPAGQSFSPDFAESSLQIADATAFTTGVIGLGTAANLVPGKSLEVIILAPTAADLFLAIDANWNWVGSVVSKVYQNNDISFTITCRGSSQTDIYISAKRLDHGELDGLGDDDHTQYVLADGTRSMATLDVTGEAQTYTLGVGTSGATLQGALHVRHDSTSTDTLYLESNDDGSDAAPILSFKRESTSPADGDYLGQIKFRGDSDTGADRVYAKITGKTSDVTNSTEDGLIEIMVRTNGSNNITSRFTGTALKLINGQGLEVDGNITVGGTVDGRDIATDGSTQDSHIADSSIHFASSDVAGTSFPGSPYSGQMFYRTDLEDTFWYNSTLSKWLGSPETFAYGFTANLTIGSWFKTAGNTTTSAKSGHSLGYAATITGYAYTQNAAVGSGNYRVYINGVGSTSFAHTAIKASGTLNIDVAANDVISVKNESGVAVAAPVLNLTIKRKAT
jgi:hypothetical protein